MPKNLCVAAYDSKPASGAIVNWDQLPFDELCERARPILRSVVDARLDHRLRQRVDASDVVQEAMLEAFRRLEDFKIRKPMPILVWLRETVLQQLKVAIRHHQIAEKRSINKQISFDQSSVFLLAEQLTAVQATAATRSEETEAAARTHQALMGLPSLDREILLLRYVNALSNVEAAAVLGVSTTVASKPHCRALVRLQQALTGDAGTERY